MNNEVNLENNNTLDNKKVRLGIIGSGVIVENFLDAAKKVDNLELYSFYSRSEDTACKFKEKYGFEKTYTDLNKMSEDENLDAVYIASPNSLHHDQAILFLENKKHVLCEKAFASNAREVKNMIDTAKKNDVVLMEAMRLTVLPNFLKIKDNLHKIGKIRRYFASFCQYSSRYDKFKEGIVLNAFKNELSNGSLMDIGVYCIAPLINLFGKPDSVFATSYMLSTGVDGEGSAVMKYDDMDAVIMYSKIANSSVASEIQGENGSIIIEKINTFSKVKIVYNDKSVEDISVDQYENDMYYEIDEFVKLVRNSSNGANYSTLNTLENSLKVIEVIDDIRNKIGLVYSADNK